MADNVHRKSHKLLDGNRKISTPINRTTTETMRLEEPDRTHPALGLSVPSNITPANQCKKKTSSFQITSVTVGSRMSNDTGEDSNDDLDESHGEDTSVELSRITDIETPSYSEDTFSKDDVFFNASNAALSTAPVIPTSSQYGLAIVPSESGNVNNSTNNSNINTLDIASVTDNNIINLLSSNAKQDTDIREVHSHGRNERFKVVKIESTEPFKRGRWTCMDYLDHTSVNHSNTIGTPKIPDPNEVCISYGVADGGIIALDSTKSSTLTEDQGISVDMNGHATHQDIHGSLPISNASTTGYQTNKPMSHNVQCNAASVQTSPQIQRTTQIPSQYFSSSTPQSQQMTSQQQQQQQQQQTNEQQSHQSDKPHQNEQSQQTSEQNQHQTSGQQKCDQQQSSVQQKCDLQQQSNGQSQSNMLQCDPQQQQQSNSQQQQSNNQQGSTLPTNLQNVHPNNNLGQTQSMPQGSIPIITQTNNNNVTPQQSICHAKEDAYVTSNSQNQSIPSQNICQSNTSGSQANVITTSHQSQSQQQQQQQQQQQTLTTRNSMTQVSESMGTIQGMQGMQNIHKSQPQQVNTQQSGPIQGPLVSGQVLTSTSMQPQTGGANTQVQLPQVSANCQNVISAIQQGNMGFQQSDTEQDSMSGSGTAGSSQLADAALLECLVEVTQANDDHHALEDNESMSGTSAVAIDNKIEQAMDLVKSHLMFAVREEVEVLKEKIAELMDRINQLEAENMILKAHATAETLAQLSQSSTKLPQNNSGSGQ